MSYPPSMTPQTYAPSVANGGLIDFHDAQTALYTNLYNAQVQAPYAQAQVLAPYTYGPAQHAQYVQATPPTQYVQPQGTATVQYVQPQGTATVQYVQPQGTATVQYVQPPATGQYVQPQATGQYVQAQPGVVVGDPKVLQYNGKPYYPEAAATLSPAETERSIQRRVNQRLNEFSSRQGSLSARPSTSGRAQTKGNDYAEELRRLNSEMGRALSKANKAR